MQTLIGEDKILSNEQLYGSTSVDDASMINSDESLDEQQRAAALLDPETYKFRKSNPYALKDAENYPSIFENLQYVDKFSITRAYQDELKKYEDQLKNTVRTNSPWKNTWREFRYEQEGLKLDALQADLMDAIKENDDEKTKEVQKKILEQQLYMNEMIPPSRQSPGAIGSLAASVGREFVPMLLAGAATTVLGAFTPETAGATAPAAAATAGRFALSLSRIKNAYSAYRATKTAAFVGRHSIMIQGIINSSIIYNDTSKIERGAAYTNLKQKYPTMSEDEVQQKAWMIGHINGSVEAINGFLGVFAAGGRAVTGIARRSFLKSTLNKTIEKAAISAEEKAFMKKAISNYVENGIITPEIVSNNTFLSKLSTRLNNLAESRTGQVALFGLDMAAEGATEAYQDEINDVVSEQKVGETAGYYDVISQTNANMSAYLGEVFNRIVTGEEMSEKAKERLDTFLTVSAGAGFFGGMFKGVDIINKRIISKEAQIPANQYDNANRTIDTFNTVLEQKKNSALYGKSPETTSSFYKSAVKNGELPTNVYADVDKLHSILKEAQNNPAVMAKLNALKIPDKLAEAGENEDLVEMSTSDFVDIVLDPKDDTLYQMIKGNITTNPAMESKDVIEKQIQQIIENDAAFAEQFKEKDSIYKMVYENQIKAGSDENLAKVNAIVAQAFFNTFQRMRSDKATMEQIVNEIKLRIENVNKITSGDLNEFAGPKALTASSEMLSKAKIMEQNNVPMHEILMDTGWFRDPNDNQWKFEISDIDAKINETILKKMFSNKFKNATLKDVLQHDLLYKAYPWLADIEVRYNPHMKGAAGQVYHENGKQVMDVKKTENFVGLRYTILHEVAHLIQDVEGFAKGGSPKGKIHVPENLQEYYIERQKLQNELWEELKKGGVKPVEDIDTSKYYVGHWAFMSAVPYIKKLAKGNNQLQEKINRFEELNKRLEKVDERDPRYKYYKIPGENEARDVAVRADMTEKERAETLPANLSGVFAPRVIFKVENEITEVQVEEELGPQIAGSIEFGAETIIRLSKISNPTTFSHEMAHLFGRQLFGNYNAGLLTEHWAKNADKLAEFLGIQKNEFGQYQFAGNTEAEERVAESFTTYLKTGKAPAWYLKELFDLFKEWFSNIWSAIRNNDIKLDPKVTKVFDEIFVPYEKQKQILIERRYGFIPKPDNMTDEQYEKYIAEKRAAASRGQTEETKMAAKLQEVMSNDTYKAEYEASYNEAFDDLSKLPVYQMIDDILKYKINRGSLAKIPSDIVIPRNYLSSKSGLDISQVVAQYENLAQTPEGIAQLLAETPTKESAAAYIAEKHMEQWLEEKYPELAEINSELAARNERVFKLAVMEYMMLSGIGMERFSQVHNDLLAASEYMVQKMPISKIVNTQRWIEQENKLVQRYEYTQSNKDKAKIKRQQAILNYYAMRSKQLRAEYKKFIRRSKKYRGPQTKDILKRIDGDTFDLLKSILGQFGVTQAKPNTNIPLSVRIDDWVKMMSNENYTGAEEIQRYSDALVAGVENKMTTADFELLNEAFDFIEKIGLSRKQIIVEGEKINVEDAAQMILNEYAKSGTKPMDKELGSAVMREAVFRSLFPEDVFLKFFAPFFEGLTKKDLQIQKWRDEVAQIIKPLYKKMQNKLIINGHSYTLENLLVMMLNSGNTHNINCMVKTLQFQLNDLEYTVDDFFSVLNQAPKELREMTRRIWKIFDDNKEAFQETQRKIDGKILKFVQPDAYEFEDGEQMPGGYYPAGKTMVVKNFNDSNSTFKNNSTYATKSFQMERENAPHGDLDLTLGTLTSWFYKMASTLNIAVPFNNIGKLLENETFRRTVGDGMVKTIASWMQLSNSPDKVNQVLSAVNQIASVSILGLSPIKTFTQMSGIIPAMNEIGPFWIMKGIMSTNPINAIGQAAKLSPYMYARYAHPADHLHLYTQSKDLIGSQLINVGKEAADKISTGAMMFIIYGDAIASCATWKAEFAKQKAAGRTDKQASDLADSRVRTLQGDASSGSRAPIIQGNARFFTMFASYFIGIHSLVYSHMLKGNEKTKAIGMIFAAAIAAPVFESIFKTGWKWLLSDDDDKEKMSRDGVDDVFDLFLKESTENILSTAGAIWIPHFGLGGDLGSALATGRTYAPENIQLKYMMKPIELLASIRGAIEMYSEGDEEKATKKIKKGLQSILEFSMLNPRVSDKVSDIIIGE